MNEDTIVLLKQTGQQYTVSVVQCVPPGQEATAPPPWYVQTVETEAEANAASEELRQRLGIETPVIRWFP
jgi:hypothetical protein